MIHSPEFFDQSPSAGFDGVFDWDFLDPAWQGSRCRLMDLDAVLERYGRFLIFETKHGYEPGRPLDHIPEGQRITLAAFASLRAFAGHYPFTVVFCGKSRGAITGFDVWHGGLQTTYHGTADRLKDFARRWFEKASAGQSMTTDPDLDPFLDTVSAIGESSHAVRV